MPRLWPTYFALGVIAFDSLGCAGQNLEGRWQGPFPLEGSKDCVLKVYGDERFDLVCDKDLWVGAGRYSHDSKSLRFDFSVLFHHGQRVSQPPSIACGLEGHGNDITLTLAGQSYPLRRRMN